MRTDNNRSELQLLRHRSLQSYGVATVVQKDDENIMKTGLRWTRKTNKAADDREQQE